MVNALGGHAQKVGTDMHRVQEAGDALRDLVARIEQEVTRVGVQVRDLSRTYEGSQKHLEWEIEDKLWKWATKVGLPVQPLGDREKSLPDRVGELE